MKLIEYLETKKLSRAAFARQIEVGRWAVTKWCLPRGHPNHQVPSARMQEIIFRETDGAVQPNDWYDLTPSGLGAPAEAAAC